MGTNIVKIELSADQMYYTIIGNKKDMSLLLSEINKYNDDTKYIISKLCIPIAHIVSDNQKVDNFMEQVQCSMLCDCDIKEEKKVYALMRIEKDEDLDVPRYIYVDAKEDCEPESLIIDEINKIFNRSDIIESIIKSIRLVDIISSESDTLIYISRYCYNKRK